jgi:sugar/nucleoside kinase (ribokinase family)
MATASGNLIVVCGHLCLDVIPSFPPGGAGQDWFRPGRLSVVDAATISTGGAVSNVGLALHRLGVPVRLVAGIGSDPLGRMVLDRVNGEGPGLADALTVLEGQPTSYTVVLSPPGVDRIFLHCPGANDSFTGDEVSDTAFTGGSLFHFGYPPLMHQIWSDGGTRLSRLLARAHAAGLLTSLDMSLPDPASPSGRADWPAFLDRVLPQVDIFVPSIEELLFMLDRDGFEKKAAHGGGEAIIRGITFGELDSLAGRILAHGVSVVLIKLGDRGAYLRTSSSPFSKGGPAAAAPWAGRELYAPCFRVPSVAGTTGAGDSTIAGFLASLVRGLDPVAALRMAVAVGGCCVEAPDAISGIRPWTETTARVAAGWSRADTPPRETGWSAVGDGSWTRRAVP